MELSSSTVQLSRQYWRIFKPRFFSSLSCRRSLTSGRGNVLLATKSQQSTANSSVSIPQFQLQSPNCQFHRHFSTSLSKLSSPTLEKALTSIFSDEGKRRAIKRMENTKPLRTLTKHASQLGAVCIPLCVIDGEPSVLYTLRTIHLSQHRGEVSFPGGMAEQGDKDLNHTALRELEEELGISADSVEVWGSLIPLPDKSGKKAVTPIIGYVGELDLDALKPNEGEVEDVFTLTFKQLCTSENQRYTHFKATGPRRESMAMPVFLGGPHRIWGLTAIITDQMLRVLLPTVYKSVVNYKR